MIKKIYVVFLETQRYNGGKSKNARRASRALGAGAGIMLVVCVVLAVLVILVGGPLIALFGLTEEATALGRDFFRQIALFYPVYGGAMALRGYLEGIGDVLCSSVIGLVCLGLRIALSYGLAGLVGSPIIAYAEVACWSAMLALFVLRFWQKRRGTGRQGE